MRARTARPAIIGTLAATLALLSSAALVVAKEGGIVSLAAPIPRDADPGSTLTVEFSVTVETDDGLRPLQGSPIVLRLTGPDGSSTEAIGVEGGTPGTYRATIEVPASGISSAVFGLRGSSVAPDGSTMVQDVGFDVDGLLFTTAANPAPAPAAPPSPPAASPALDITPAIVGAAIAIAGLIVAGLALASVRRRSLGSA